MKDTSSAHDAPSLVSIASYTCKVTKAKSKHAENVPFYQDPSNTLCTKKPNLSYSGRTRITQTQDAHTQARNKSFISKWDFVKVRKISKARKQVKQNRYR